MANGINFEPFRTQGSFRNAFNVESRGLVQGDAQADPAVRLQLSTGWLPNDLDAPVYGGIPISESIAPINMNVAGALIRAATTRSNGICVFNQAYHGVITAGNNVPQYMAGGTIHYYRYGSLARIPMAISQAVLDLATSGNSDVDSVFVWDAENGYVDVQGASTGGNAFVVEETQDFEPEDSDSEKAKAEEAEGQPKATEGGESSSDTRLVLPIKLLWVSSHHNMTIKKDSNGSVVWDYEAPAAVFMI